MTLQVDHLIMEALREDISSEDVTTNAVMHEAVTGEVDLICKQDGVIAGLQVFQRVFELLDKALQISRVRNPHWRRDSHSTIGVMAIWICGFK